MLLFQVNSREISEKGKGNLLHNKKGGDFMGNTYTTELPSANRIFKSSVFTMLYSDPKEALMLYSDPKEALQLYNAVNGTEYKDPELLEINTLENAIYMGIKNDVSFVIDSRLSLYEHQSTYSLNLPLRFLMYVSDLYSVMTKDHDLYSEKMISIPAPRFVIFYNGEKKRPEPVFGEDDFHSGAPLCDLL